MYLMGGPWNTEGGYYHFGDSHEVEMAHRTRKGWGKFMGNKDILCNKFFPLGDRLRLWEATVTATVLYGSDAWTMTKKRESGLRAVQRKMLRMMLGSGRKAICREGEEEEEEDEDGDGDSDDDRGSEEDSEDDEEGEEEKEEIETWVEWLVRTTRLAEALGKRARVSLARTCITKVRHSTA